MAVVKVKLVGLLKRYAPADPMDVVVADNVAIGEIPALLGIPAGQVFRFVANGSIVDASYAVRDQDEVSLLPPIAGGVE